MMKSVIRIGIIVLIALAAICWSYVRATSYVIVSQKSFVSTPNGKSATRGFAVRSPDELIKALKEHGVAESDFYGEQGSVDFNKGFVFIVENGALLEINHGFSGFDIAAVTSSTNLSVAVVRGPNSRPIKAVAR